MDEKAKATFYFDSYLSRQPIAPNTRQPCLSDARFESINKMPSVSSKFRKPVDISIGLASPRVTRHDAKNTSRFYDTDEKFKGSVRLDLNAPMMRTMQPHDPKSYRAPCSPEGSINYKKAVDTKTSLKPRTLTLQNFNKQEGRTQNVYVNERKKNVILDNTKDERIKAAKEAKELRKRFPSILTP